MQLYHYSFFFFLNDPATTEIYPLPLRAALPIFNAGINVRGFHPPVERHLGPPLPRIIADEIIRRSFHFFRRAPSGFGVGALKPHAHHGQRRRSEEHTSELQSQSNLVCRLLLDKK